MLNTITLHTPHQVIKDSTSNATVEGLKINHFLPYWAKVTLQLFSVVATCICHFEYLSTSWLNWNRKTKNISNCYWDRLLEVLKGERLTMRRKWKRGIFILFRSTWSTRFSPSKAQEPFKRENKVLFLLKAYKNKRGMGHSPKNLKLSTCESKITYISIHPIISFSSGDLSLPDISPRHSFFYFQ